MPRRNQRRLSRYCFAPAAPPRPANDNAVAACRTGAMAAPLLDAPVREFDRAWDIGRLLVANIRRGRPHGMW